MEVVNFTDVLNWTDISVEQEQSNDRNIAVQAASLLTYKIGKLSFYSYM